MSTSLIAQTKTQPSSLAKARPTGFVKRHAVAIYYVLTFAISWGGILVIVGGPGGIPGTQAEIDRLMPLAIPFMLLGPGLAGVIMTGLVDGRPGYRELVARLLTWRVGVGWYAVAVLTAPLIYLLVLLALSLTSPVFVPGIVTASDKATFLLIGTAPGFLVGCMEELGWTGFAIPRLRLRYSVLSTGLIAGVLWGGWHILTNDLWAADVSAAGVPLSVYMTLSALTFLVGQLPAFRVLMVWVYERTNSLLLAMLMHASLVFSTFVLGPVAIAGIPILIYGIAVGAAMWIVVAVLRARKEIR